MATPSATFRSAYRAQRRALATTPRRPRTPVLTHLGRLTARALPTWAGFRRATLSLTGFAALTSAAWTIHTAAGLAAAGVSLLLLEWLTAGDAT
jgi:hypothetical protein